MKISLKTLFVTAIILLALGFGIWSYFRSSSTITTSPKVGDIMETVYGLGTVSAQNIYHVRTGTALTVSEVFVQEGQNVKKGDPLIKLDTLVFKSPINGVVTNINFKKGELVNAQTTVMTVTDLKNLYLEVSLEQQSILRVKTNQEVKVSFESIRNEKFEGIIRSVFPREKQFLVRVELKRWPEGVLPGMTADLAIIVGQKREVILIPIGAVVAGKVTRLRDNKKEKIDVKIGAIDNNWAEVTSGNIEKSDLLVMKVR